MTELDAVNLCLRKLGETPVTSVDEQYPTLAIIQSALVDARRQILEDGWWFNMFDNVDLVPDVNQQIIMTDTTLMFYPDEPDKWAYGGTFILNAETGTNIVTETVRGRVILDKEFEELPILARYVVAYKAAYETYVGDFSPDSTAQDIAREYTDYFGRLSAAHTRQRKWGTRDKKQYQRYLLKLRN